NERALSAENKAAEALNKATEAANAAAEARARSEKNTSGLESLRYAVSNFDEYKLVAETTVQFEYGQDKLTPGAKEIIDKFAAEKGGLKRFVVLVQGFTDKSGSTRYNNALSKRRADAVVNYLTTQHNTPGYRIYAEGLGSQAPADEGTTSVSQ